MTDYIVLVTAWSHAGLFQGVKQIEWAIWRQCQGGKNGCKGHIFHQTFAKLLIRPPSRVVSNSCMHQCQKTQNTNHLTAKVQLLNRVTTNWGQARRNALVKPAKVCARPIFACTATPLRGKSSSLFPEPSPRPPADTTMAMSKADRGCPA